MRTAQAWTDLISNRALTEHLHLEAQEAEILRLVRLIQKEAYDQGLKDALNPPTIDELVCSPSLKS